MPALAPRGQLLSPRSILHYDRCWSNLRDRQRFSPLDYRVYARWKAEPDADGAVPPRACGRRVARRALDSGARADRHPGFERYQANPIGRSSAFSGRSGLKRYDPSELVPEHLTTLNGPVDPPRDVPGRLLRRLWVGSVDGPQHHLHRQLTLERIGIVRAGKTHRGGVPGVAP